MCTFLVLILSTAIVSPAFCQSTIDASGGEGVGAGGVVSYSVGQVFYETFTSDSATIAGGVQQPYEISGVRVEELTDGDFGSFHIYPNPAKDYVILSTDQFLESGLRWELYNSQGKLILSENIQTCQTSISLDQLAFDIYFLKLFNSEREITLFKIIKC